MRKEEISWLVDKPNGWLCFTHRDSAELYALKEFAKTSKPQTIRKQVCIRVGGTIMDRKVTRWKKIGK